MTSPAMRLPALKTRSFQMLGLACALLAGILVVGSLIAVGDLSEVPVALDLASPAAETEDPASEAMDGEDAVLVGLPTSTYELALARDPFEPVIPEPEAPTPPTGAPGASADPDDNGDAVGNGVDAPGGQGSAPQDPDARCRDRGELVCDGQVVTVISTDPTRSPPQATIEVDGTRYAIEPGDRFAGSFELLAVSDRCVTILFGDEVVRPCIAEADGSK